MKSYPLWLAAVLKRNQRLLREKCHPSQEIIDSFTLQECETLARKHKLKLFEGSSL